MPRGYQVRWNKRNAQQIKADEDALKREIRNFNQRVRYQQKKNPEADYLPSTYTYKDLDRFIQTREDYNWVMKTLQKFGASTAYEVDVRGEKVRTLKTGVRKAGAKGKTQIIKDDALTMTKWEHSFIQSANKKQYKKKLKEWERIKDEPVLIAGEEQDASLAKMREAKDLEMAPKLYDITKGSKEKQYKTISYIFADIDKVIEAQRLQNMVDNYIKGLRWANFLNDAPELETYIRGLNPQQVYDTMKLDDDATFLYYNDPVAYEVRLENIIKAWKAAYEKHVPPEKRDKELYPDEEEIK